ncbi:flagellar hook protein FliD [Stutzerimonas nosocomialis]|uniref:flagellar filament capping protein FliD n=1 Tax=Stutzerimonas nosocomialis TaxID=1056496 RepID=UPI001107B3F5|nr:flagellar filament capping protein FliD [Stutzerimonas nosocomialis]TLX59178.1 flagellar hook protein FliD [Stutzerimonas nosocomialis]
MAIDSDYIQQMSKQLADYEVQSSLNRLNRNEANYKAQRTALSTLRTSLSTFNSVVKGLKSTTSTMLVNSATFSQDGYASATVGTKAVPGSYNFFVEQLASAHQVAIGGLSAADIGTQGTLTIGQGGSSFDIDLSTVDSDGNGSTSLEELAAAINQHAGNTGTKATLVRSNGEVSLVLSSEKSGADNAISLQTSGTTAALSAAIDARQELTRAQDARVRLGGESGMLLTNASNTFDSVIDGVSLTFTKTHAAGEQPLSLEIGQDKSATKEKAQSFVNAFNTLMTSLDSLTASGNDTTARGPLAGDSSIRAIENRLNQLLRTDFGGVNLISFGISADRNGKLTIDAARFDAAVANDPEGFEKLFTGKGNLLDSIDKNLSVYTSSANGVLKNRMDTLDMNLRRIDEQFDKLQEQYNSFYARYLKQYTSMMQTMQAMEQTFGMF